MTDDISEWIRELPTSAWDEFDELLAELRIAAQSDEGRTIIEQHLSGAGLNPEAEDVYRMCIGLPRVAPSVAVNRAHAAMQRAEQQIGEHKMKQLDRHLAERFAELKGRNPDAES